MPPLSSCYVHNHGIGAAGALASAPRVNSRQVRLNIYGEMVSCIVATQSRCGGGSIPPGCTLLHALRAAAMLLDGWKTIGWVEVGGGVGG